MVTAAQALADKGYNLRSLQVRLERYGATPTLAATVIGQVT